MGVMCQRLGTGPVTAVPLLVHIGSHAVHGHSSLHSAHIAAAGKAAETRKGPGRLPRFGVVSGASYVLQEVRSSDREAGRSVLGGNTPYDPHHLCDSRACQQ